ncbi:hypothetical protein [Isoptericola sp. NPDC056605]|uniref:hypothetical protein n=1 Tax=Isoptericola sp. NPDC056605 TaxID=3345876 RepID=UPI0036C08914
MTTPGVLFEALKALRPTVPALTPAFHDFQASNTATAPWLVGNLQMPEPIPGMVANTHGATATWRVTVSAKTGVQALVLADAAEQAWKGARITVPGYAVGALRPPRITGPYAAGLTATDTDLRFQVVVLEFDLTVSRTA